MEYINEIILAVKTYFLPNVIWLGAKITELIAFSKENPAIGLVFGGSISVWITKILTVLFRSIPGYFSAILSKQFTMEITINKCDSAFYDLVKWYDEQGFGKHARTLRYSAQHSRFGNEEDQNISAGFGHHWFWRRLRPFKFIRIREADQGTDKVKEQILIRTWGRSQKPIRKLIEDACPIKPVRDRKPRLKKWDSYDWEYIEDIEVRSTESVNLPKATKDKIYSHLEGFMNEKEWYLKNGLKHRTGLCFYGPPGTGKTSLTRVLASKYNKDLYYMSLNGMTDASLQQAIDKVPASGLILIEDIDSYGSVKSRDNEDNSENVGLLTLSGILNILDGIKSCNERIVIVTTNHLEKIDKAILRPGRIDSCIELGYLTDEVFREMLKRFYPEFMYSKSLVLNGETVSPAEVENAIIENKKDPSAVLRKFTRNTKGEE